MSNAHDPRTPVTVLGLGAMGSALAGAFVGAGHPTTVWNRTPGKAEDLVARGAVRADTVAEAVAASPLVIVCVVDYAAAHEILEPAGPQLSGRVLVNLTSDTPERARSAAVWAAGHGIDYLDGSVMVPTPDVGQPGATLLYSGSRQAFETYEETLKVLGGRAAYLGDDHARAAVYDLALLAFFYSAMAGLVHAFALAGAEGVPAGEFVPFTEAIAGILPPIAAGMAQDLDRGVLRGDQDNIVMEAAGMAHIIEASVDRGINTDVLGAVKGLADRTIAAGHGKAGFLSIIGEMRKPSAKR
ncbi:NAD(P)-dependent oxidoreductase [Streptomyces sp. Isolate_219]|uniref:NAD(P)-dependent oxidoreductase n=1 Tax=Streptomyces sp. Isolate_219 TaxID=2950110 RepID=UPI0021C64C16|nr:NAD(P)-binding domain-containing protein [Streptomyces sp. Isolate_219]MCR8575771.1 NAD(P)-binding domain-containing protein [Streptomyces sp. Isolate_219]